MQKQLQASEYVHGDETDWREKGHNGYLGSFSTPETCFFTYSTTRAGSVVTDVLGSDYNGIVVSEFYGGCNAHLGLHQRGWVHLLAMSMLSPRSSLCPVSSRGQSRCANSMTKPVRLLTPTKKHGRRRECGFKKI